MINEYSSIYEISHRCILQVYHTQWSYFLKIYSAAYTGLCDNPERTVYFMYLTKDFRFFNFIHRKETAFQIMIYMHSKQ